jgi:hypothetical protein
VVLAVQAGVMAEMQLEIMVRVIPGFMVAQARLLEVQAAVVLFVSSGPVQLGSFHQPTQVICNGTLYSY